jgi:hypothetical protein
VLDDVDDDGASDILLRGAGWTGTRVPTWVVSGRSGKILANGQAEGWSCGIWTSTGTGCDLDGDGWEDWVTVTNGLAIRHSSKSGEILDPPVASAASATESWRPTGDFDGDGRTGFLVRGGGKDCDGVRVVSGKDGGTLAEIVDPWLEDDSESDICTIGDQDGDGRSDFVIASWGWRRHTCVRIVSSETRATVRRLVGVLDTDRGVHLRDAGDMDGDGVHDLLVASEEAGACLFSGCDGRVLLEARLSPSSKTCAWGSETGFARESCGFVSSNGEAFVLIAATEVNVAVGQVECWSVSRRRCVYIARPPLDDDDWHFGARIEVLGDVDDDGTPDFLACPDHTCCGNPARMYVCSGRTGKILWSAVRTLTGLDIER